MIVVVLVVPLGVHCRRARCLLLRSSLAVVFAANRPGRASLRTLRRLGWSL